MSHRRIVLVLFECCGMYSSFSSSMKSCSVGIWPTGPCKILCYITWNSNSNWNNNMASLVSFFHLFFLLLLYHLLIRIIMLSPRLLRLLDLLIFLCHLLQPHLLLRLVCLTQFPRLLRLIYHHLHRLLRSPVCNSLNLVWCCCLFHECCAFIHLLRFYRSCFVVLCHAMSLSLVSCLKFYLLQIVRQHSFDRPVPFVWVILVWQPFHCSSSFCAHCWWFSPLSASFFIPHDNSQKRKEEQRERKDNAECINRAELEFWVGDQTGNREKVMPVD